MKHFLSILLFSTLLILNTEARTAEEWKSRSVYQIITDRFAKTDGDATPCNDLYRYCGGTFQGILNNLDYIEGMGFNAIWISPVVENTEGGYHGYWAKNLYKINENFGTAEELKELIRTCHSRDIWVMIDVVANHMGYTDNGDYSSIIPFNDVKYYNPYRHCDEIDFNHQPDVETCWLNGLPDLDQANPEVKDLLIDWAKDFVRTYDVDALRIDTVPHVAKSFWAEFTKKVGVYTIGEVLNFNLPYLASYQGAVDGVLNYALYSTLRYTFQSGGSMDSIQHYYDGAHSTWADISILGNFINNHDNPRFLAHSGNVAAFKSALAFSIASVGIPMVYYGDEQAYGGGQDPLNREPLWTNMNAESDIYHFLKTINEFRKETKFWAMDQVQRYSDSNFYAFTRGNYFFAFTNSLDYQSRSISFHNYPEGTTLCNILYQGDCVEVKNGQFPVVLLNGETKIFVPMFNDQQADAEKESTLEGLAMAIGSSTLTGARSMGF